MLFSLSEESHIFASGFNKSVGIAVAPFMATVLLPLTRLCLSSHSCELQRAFFWSQDTGFSSTESWLMGNRKWSFLNMGSHRKRQHYVSEGAAK